jgi:aminoglycoside phosphotransferase (APT) family kinase protein
VDPLHTDLASLHQLLREALGTSVDLTSYDVLKAVHDYVVIRAHFGGGMRDAVIKLAGARALLATPFEQSAHLNRLVRAAGVPTFEVLAADTSTTGWPWCYLISTWLPGETWAHVRGRLRSEDQPRVYREFGRAVGRLHTIQFPTFGELAADGRVHSDGSYSTALLARARRRLRRLSSESYVELFESVIEANADAFADPPTACLTHDDLNHTNIVLVQDRRGWGISGILDFEAAWSGSAEPDLARLDFWRGMTDEGFWQAYRDVRPVPKGFDRRRHLLRFLWCLEFARATPDHLRDTAAVCAALGIEPVVFT